MSEKSDFEYYYGADSEQFSFLMIPKFLIREEKFSDMSDGSKMLYSHMLERMSLSRKNGWYDEENRTYIIFSVDAAMAELRKSKPTVIKFMKELEETGLIERRKLGQGRPSIVYVKKYTSEKQVSKPLPEPEVKKLYFKKSNNFTSRSKESLPQEVKDVDFKKSKDFTSRSQNILPLEVKELDPNNNECKEPEMNNKSYQSISFLPEDEGNFGVRKDIDMIDDTDPEKLQEMWTGIIRDNISYDELIRTHKWDKDRIDEFIRLMVMVICFGKDSYNISGCSIPAKIVRAQFEKLNMDHILYVLESFNKTNVPMTAPDNYILASLYSSYNTSHNETAQQCNYDMNRPL